MLGSDTARHSTHENSKNISEELIQDQHICDGQRDIMNTFRRMFFKESVSKEKNK